MSASWVSLGGRKEGLSVVCQTRREIGSVRGSESSGYQRYGVCMYTRFG